MWNYERIWAENKMIILYRRRHMAIIYVNNKNNGYYLEYLLHTRRDSKGLNKLIHLIFSTL